ncbi:NADH dehydrogenase subunit F [Geoalkalibacter ferrihydriticus]|uniref:NADH dehydrogenase n=2 Tax=Geoalkalibacter ferrihydriticus TaxID=392333 RepID=A0A0C2EC57_9BACT|nr:NADH-ubiquinone oxidoreductase-F iron-sulfur binding region domain-containing protein [Geoalkalibacter ferrihydriticus]KIH76133.1 NADH dehydrogenase [Geoalkalibacter ferrihydriticus DSM 17813]SDM43519.1 NADH dehydrogenase subunit F [Geoalkalibacter ferrihydriticus]
MKDYPQILFKNRRPGETLFLDGYRAAGGYGALKKALTQMTPQEVIDEVKNAGLRGRGGSGFPTGQKWAFFPAQKAGVKYLVCNGDEMEPGTYKDRQLLLADPHQLIEGMIIAAYALQIDIGYIFLRYAYEDCARRVERAIAEARQAGYLGNDILGSGFFCDLRLHRSAGRYILGEETALLNGLEGRRPNPRAKPPFPVNQGLFDRPTVINNVETLANVPHIINGGADWYRGVALTAEGAGSKIFGLSGHLEATPCVELPLGVPLGEIIEHYGGGVWRGRRFKACLPGGASTPYLTRAHLDLPMDFDAVQGARSRLGTACITVFDDRTCMLAATLNLIRFFARESCGWCTPCRDGLVMVTWLLEKIEGGTASMDDVYMLQDQMRNISGQAMTGAMWGPMRGEYVFKVGSRAFCPLADGAMAPVEALLRLFRDEVEDHVKQGRCPF